jgi:hypothetical protein
MADEREIFVYAVNRKRRIVVLADKAPHFTADAVDPGDWYVQWYDGPMPQWAAEKLGLRYIMSLSLTLEERLRRALTNL